MIIAHAKFAFCLGSQLEKKFVFPSMKSGVGSQLKLHTVLKCITHFVLRCVKLCSVMQQELT